MWIISTFFCPLWQKIEWCRGEDKNRPLKTLILALVRQTLTVFPILASFKKPDNLIIHQERSTTKQFELLWLYQLWGSYSNNPAAMVTRGLTGVSRSGLWGAAHLEELLRGQQHPEELLNLLGVLGASSFTAEQKLCNEGSAERRTFSGRALLSLPTSLSDGAVKAAFDMWSGRESVWVQPEVCAGDECSLRTMSQQFAGCFSSSSLLPLVTFVESVSEPEVES